MVQEMPSSSVPEELYNLTQLAEVSIAAGKLSTATNASPGEQYHHHHHHHYPAQYGAGVKYYTLQHESAGYHPAEYYQYALSYHGSLRDDNEDGRKGYPNSPSPSAIEQKKEQLQQQQHPLQSCSATKKKWKTNWEINRNLKLQQAQRINKIRDADERADGDDSYETGGGLTYYTSTIRAVENAAEASPTRSGSSSRALTEEEQLLDRRSSYASEESEDSSYSYSHKVFDRKKSRTLSWNSGSSYSYGEDGHRGPGGERLEYGGIDDREYRELREAGERTTASSGDEVGSTDDVHCCPECGKKYSTSSNLARHRQTHR